MRNKDKVKNSIKNSEIIENIPVSSNIITEVEDIVFKIEELIEHKICDVNFYSETKNRSSIKYECNGNYYFFFIDGKYTGKVKVYYKDKFSVKNIVNVEQV